MNNKIVCVIPAKSKSQRLPGKNMKILDGMPLIYYSVYEALKVDMIDKVYALTDSSTIGKFAWKLGATYLLDRYAKEHPDGRGGWDMIGALIRRLELRNKDILIYWQPTNPLLEASDIKKMLAVYVSNNCDSVIACGAVREHPAWMLKQNHQYAEPVSRMIYKSEDNPELFIAKGLWMASVARLKENKGYYGSKIKIYQLPPDKAVDIDDALDFTLAELILKKRKYEKEVQKRYVKKKR